MPRSPDLFQGTTLLFIKGRRLLYRNVRRSEREADHLRLSRAELKDECSYIFVPHICMSARGTSGFRTVVQRYSDSCTCPWIREPNVTM